MEWRMSAYQQLLLSTSPEKLVEVLNVGCEYITAAEEDNGNTYSEYLGTAEMYIELYSGKMCKWCTDTIQEDGGCGCTVDKYIVELVCAEGPSDDGDIERINDYSLQMHYHSQPPIDFFFVKEDWSCERSLTLEPPSPLTHNIIEHLLIVANNLHPIFHDSSVDTQFYKDLVKNNFPIILELIYYITNHDVMHVIEPDTLFHPFVIHLNTQYQWYLTLANKLFNLTIVE